MSLHLHSHKQIENKVYNKQKDDTNNKNKTAQRKGAKEMHMT